MSLPIWLPDRMFLLGGLCSGVLCPLNLCPWVLCPGSYVQGVYVQGDLRPRGLCKETPPDRDPLPSTTGMLFGSSYLFTRRKKIK